MELGRFIKARSYLDRNLIKLVTKGRERWTFEVGKYSVIISHRLVSCTCKHTSNKNPERYLYCGHIIAVLHEITEDKMLRRINEVSLFDQTVDFYDALTEEEQAEFRRKICTPN